MTLPLAPPLAPMLAKAAGEIPDDDGWLYEPKWDGFRCLLYRDGETVELHSRNQRPLARYFPEVVSACRELPSSELVLDGELMVFGDRGVDFAALMARLHPASSRVALLAATSPATFVAFDLLEIEGAVLVDQPFRDRRHALERMLPTSTSVLVVTPATADAEVARGWLERHNGRGIDGVVVKHRDMRYEPGRRVMTKVKPERTLDCVVAGFRWDGRTPEVRSLLLGLYGNDGDAGEVLHHVGVVSSFRADVRAGLGVALAPHVVALADHPGVHGFALEGGPMGRLKGSAGRWRPDMSLDWVPVAPRLVCEVAYDQVDGIRLRHPARWRRWRPDRAPRTCRVDQLVAASDAAPVVDR
jgi:ATP-dependent DNA ligase